MRLLNTTHEHSTACKAELVEQLSLASFLVQHQQVDECGLGGIVGAVPLKDLFTVADSGG